MNVTKIVFLALIIFIALNVKSQNATEAGKTVKKLQPATDYDRSALTMILLSYEDYKYAQEVQTEFTGIEVPSKFDDNTINLQILKVDGGRPKTVGEISKFVLNSLKSNKVGNAIIAKWYNCQSDGSFNMDLIKERGLYNATDLDVVNASVKEKGQDNVKDAGEKLIGNSYVLVMDYSNVKTCDEAYDAALVTEANRGYHGWVGSYSAYLFKLNFNDSVSSVFYNDLWTDNDSKSEIKAERKAKFESTHFPISYVSCVQNNLSSQQPNPGTNAAMFVVQKPDEQLFNEMIAIAVTDAEYKISKNLDAFQVKTTVFSTHPIAAKIGKKEGLKLDNRFFIYENKQKDNGDVKAVRKAVVRASSHIIDNRTNSTGQSNQLTKFYQIGGKRVDEGMLLKQKNDKGFGFFATYSSGEIGGYGLGLEYLTRIATSLKIIGDIAFEDKNYILINGADDLLFMRYSAGVSKSIYFARNFQLEPSFSFGREEAADGSTNSDGSSFTFNSYYLKPGLKFGANIRYNIQLIATANYYSFIGNLNDSNKKSYSFGWSDFFKDRKGLSLDFGLRVQF